MVTSRLSSLGCAIWSAGPLGAWDTITSLELVRLGDPRCIRLPLCSVSELDLSKLLSECSAEAVTASGVEGVTTSEIDAGIAERAVVLEKPVAGGLVHELSGFEVKFDRTGQPGSRCRSLRFFVAAEFERTRGE